MTKIYALSLLAVTCFLNCFGQTVQFTSLTTGLSSPVDIVAAPDTTGRLFIVEKTGGIRIYANSSLQPGSFVDIAHRISGGGERGLLSMAFHPDYINNRYFFVLYTNTAGDITLARLQTDATNPNIADTSSIQVIKVVPHPTFANHNGGKIIFGTDGQLYWSTGDGGSSGDPNNNAQNGNSLLGKMLRLNVDSFNTAPYYAIPPDNPYVTDTSVMDEVYAMGLRNPWRWSFDRLNGDMWIADVGQGAREEVNVVSAAAAGGKNYGWRCYEGTLTYNTTGCGPQGNYWQPVFEYGHNMSTGGYSITGGYMYRGSLYPALYGKYICADYVSGNLWVLSPGGSGVTSVLQAGLPSGISGFGEDNAGELYAVSLSGTLYSVSATAPLSAESLEVSVRRIDNRYELLWTALERDAERYEIEQEQSPHGFRTIATMPAEGNGVSTSYTYNLGSEAFGYYRIRMVHRNGEVVYSKLVNIGDQGEGEQLVVFPTLIENGKLKIRFDGTGKLLQVYDGNGKVLLQETGGLQQGTHILSLPDLASGRYFLTITDEHAQVHTSHFFIP